MARKKKTEDVAPVASRTGQPGLLANKEKASDYQVRLAATEIQTIRDSVVGKTSLSAVLEKILKQIDAGAKKKVAPARKGCIALSGIRKESFEAVKTVRIAGEDIVTDWRLVEGNTEVCQICGKGMKGARLTFVGRPDGGMGVAHRGCARGMADCVKAMVEKVQREDAPKMVEYRDEGKTIFGVWEHHRERLFNWFTPEFYFQGFSARTLRALNQVAA